MVFKDQRIKIMNEVLSGVKVRRHTHKRAPDVLRECSSLDVGD